MTVLTNRNPRLHTSRTVGLHSETMICESTVLEWAETLSIMRDESFMRDIERGLSEIENGERLYTFEEIFGESPEHAAGDGSED